MPIPLHKKLIAEFFGTFCLVFAGTGAVVADAMPDVELGVVGIALVFGLVVLAMVYTIGDISGAHINPAVTLGFWAARRMGGSEVAPYIASQCAGAVAASGLLVFLMPGHATYGATLLAGSVGQSFLLEIVITLILMYVVLSVSRGARESGITAGLVVGATVALMALFAGPISGASMNPARSLGPALASWNFTALWVYFLAPAIGACLATPLCQCVREPGCCGPAPEVGCSFKRIHPL